MGILIKDSRNNYWQEEDNCSITFYSAKDRIEFAWVDKVKKVLYIKTDYKRKFAKAKKQVINKYVNYKISEYTNMEGVI